MFKNHKFVVPAILGTALAVAACMYMDDIIFPEGDIKVNSEIEVLVKFHLETETDLANTQMVMGLLTPRSWDLANNADLYLTTEGYTTQGYADIVNEKMIPVAPTEIEFSLGQPWSDAFMSKLGDLGNTGSVQWNAWKSQTYFTINDNVSKEPIYGTVRVVMKTGPKNIKYFFGAGWCTEKRGFNDGDDARYKVNKLSKIMTVTGGSGNDDYTVFHYFSTTPNDVRYGDIFSLNLITDIDGNKLNVYGEEAIHYCMEAELADGSTVTMDTVSPETLMSAAGENSYMKYVYPKAVLGLPQDAEIKKLSVWFVNPDKSKVCKDSDPVTGTEKNFVISQSDNKISR